MPPRATLAPFLFGILMPLPAAHCPHFAVMDIFTLAILLTAAVYFFNQQQQRKRILLLAQHLHPYQIEKLMEALTDGYLRALGESSPERREQIWQLLATTETQLSEQFERFAVDFAKVEEDKARVSRLALPLPLAELWWPQATFDMRKAVAIHARGLTRATEKRSGQSERDRAFTMSAELLLMQHSCHWFCKSHALASARMQARHQTPYTQLVASVSPETRRDYLALLHGSNKK